MASDVEFDSIVYLLDPKWSRIGRMARLICKGAAENLATLEELLRRDDFKSYVNQYLPFKVQTLSEFQSHNDQFERIDSLLSCACYLNQVPFVRLLINFVVNMVFSS